MTTATLECAQHDERPLVAEFHRDYRPDIDGLRAVAIAAVVAFHAFPSLVPGGFVGVDIFFVISGYLITGIVMRDLQRGAFSLSKFYARRIRRLFPALVTVLVAVWTVGYLVLLPDEFRTLGKHIAGGAGFAANLVLYDEVSAYFHAATRPLLHLWSLGIEEQFYLIWPLLIWTTSRLGRPRAALVLALLAAASFVLNTLVIPWDALAAFYLPWNRIWELSLGGLLAHVNFTRREPPESRSFVHDLAALFGAVLIVCALFGLREGTAYPGWRALMPCMGTLLVIGAGERTWFNRLLSTRLMIFTGLISYPLYLWHWPLLSFAHILEPSSLSTARIVIAVALAVLLAFITYKWIELPIRGSRQHARAPLALCAALGVCLLVGYLTFVDIIPARPVSAVVARYVAATSESWAPWSPVRHEPLVAGNGPSRVVFIGDSHVQQYYPRAVRLLSAPGKTSREALFATRGSCPPTGGPDGGLYGQAACFGHVQRAMSLALDQNVDTVVIGAAWFAYFVTTSDGGYVLKPGADRYLERLSAMVVQLKAAGKQVYIILQSPISYDFDPRRMVRRSLLPPRFEAAPTPARPRSDIEAMRAPITFRLRQIARTTGATVIDPMEWLCDRESCPGLDVNGEPIFRDAGHLRPSFVREYVHFLDSPILGLEQRGSSPGSMLSH